MYIGAIVAHLVLRYLCDPQAPRPKDSDWIRLVFAQPFPLNNGALVASANFISDGKVQQTHDGACQTNGGPVIQDQ